MEKQLVIGQTVTGIYKTGKYIGEITNVRPEQYVVRVLAVLKHPDQGDLHNPKETDVELFHERRALAYREQTNIPKVYVKPYSDDVPSYEESLKEALKQQYTKLESDQSAWANKSIEMLQSLEKEYFKG
ncbi:kinase-associated lipoprotein B [Alkalihalobacterium alkalinitrilicum]|uniref:kinase-associated lipoprotein B n=1 Tax=Alkalihalobacterium alkalinitrilicum TaxID=427920 RepID=UPI0009949064|nr:kinase-associated lipoprotein B [Alkalihalobacterium alkalinitrilicum]